MRTGSPAAATIHTWPPSRAFHRHEGQPFPSGRPARLKSVVIRRGRHAPPGASCKSIRVLRRPLAAIRRLHGSLMMRAAPDPSPGSRPDVSRGRYQNFCRTRKRNRGLGAARDIDANDLAGRGLRGRPRSSRLKNVARQQVAPAEACDSFLLDPENLSQRSACVSRSRRRKPSVPGHGPRNQKSTVMRPADERPCPAEVGARAARRRHKTSSGAGSQDRAARSSIRADGRNRSPDMPGKIQEPSHRRMEKHPARSTTPPAADPARP